MQIANLVAALRRVVANLRARRVREGIGASCHWVVECVGADGVVKWVEEGPNLVVDQGINYLLTNGLKTNTLYVGLVSSTPTIAAADVPGSHAGWTEDQNYSNSPRPTLTLGTASSKSIDNSASKASFSMNATTTIGGAFVSDVSTKGGTTGNLINAKAFAANRSVISGDTLNVQITYTGSSS